MPLGYVKTRAEEETPDWSVEVDKFRSAVRNENRPGKLEYKTLQSKDRHENNKNAKTIVGTSYYKTSQTSDAR